MVDYIWNEHSIKNGEISSSQIINSLIESIILKAFIRSVISQLVSWRPNGFFSNDQFPSVDSNIHWPKPPTQTLSILFQEMASSRYCIHYKRVQIRGSWSQ